MSDLVSLPRKPTPEMIQAIEEYYGSRLKYKGKKSEAMKADCWMALMAYYKMVEAYEKANPPPPMTVPKGWLVV